MHDQRKYPRLAILGFVNLKIKDLKLQLSGPIELISRKGLGVYTKEKISPGTPVAIQLICFKGAETLDFSFTGIVTGSRDRILTPYSTDNEIRVIGIKFDKDINSREHLPLYQILTQNKKKGSVKKPSLVS